MQYLYILPLLFILSSGESRNNYMSPSGMPLLQHGDLKISQSGAIETYVASIAPKYKDLTPQQKAIDNMYGCIKEEILFNCAKAIFTTQKTDKNKAIEDINTLLDKWFGIFEEKLPDEGFILGLSYPTPADLALLNITQAFMPFGAAVKLASYDFSKWKKVSALCDRTAADSNVAAYLKDSPYVKANPFGL